MISDPQQAAVSGDRSTHAVDIVAFVEANELAHHHVETPYRLVPAPGGERLYSLLRDTLERTGRIAIAYVVIQAHQHLAALVPNGRSLMLNTLRWISEAPYSANPINPLLSPQDYYQCDDSDYELAWLTPQALGIVAQAKAEEADMFRADIVASEFLTEDDDDIDSALSYALRRHPSKPAQGGRRHRRSLRRHAPRGRSRLLS